MRSFNRATLIGHVGNEVVLRHTQSGKPVVNLSVATSERRKEGDDLTTWHRVVLWDRLAELADRYVRKGMAVYCEGPLSAREWKDADGVRHVRMELTARELIFLGDAPTESAPPDGEEPAEVEAVIPF